MEAIQFQGLLYLSWSQYQSERRLTKTVTYKDRKERKRVCLVTQVASGLLGSLRDSAPQ